MVSLITIIILSSVCQVTVGTEQAPIEDNSSYSDLTATLSKGLDLDGWSGEFLLDRPLWSRGRLTCTEQLSFLLFQTPGYRRQWKIDQRFAFAVRRPAFQGFDWLVKGGSERFVDQIPQRYADDVRTPPLLPVETPGPATFGTEATHRESDISSLHLALGGAYQGEGGFSTNGSIGPLLEDRGDRRLEGMKLHLNLKDDWASGELRAGGWLDRLPGGNNYKWDTALYGNHSFPGGAGDHFTVSFAHSDRREYSATGPVGRRSDEQLHLNNRLVSARSTPLQLGWDSELTRQRISRTNPETGYSDLEFVWENGVDLTWRSNRLSGIASGGVDLQEQQYDEALTQARRTHLGFTTTYRRSPDDSAGIDARVIRYRADTPDEADKNDRDELRYIVAVRAGLGLAPGFGLRVELSADLHHLVYIFDPRSEDNRWSRLFSLACELPWQDGPLDNAARFAVVSNYTDYDYPPFDTTFSRAYRSFTASDTLKLAIWRMLNLEVDLSALIDEHGRLNWQEWVEDISETGYGLTAAVIPTWASPDYSLGIGWLVHRRHTTLCYEDEKIDGESVHSHGPVATIRTPSTSRLKAELTGSVLWVEDRKRGSYRLPDIRCTLTWSL